jgi:vancomycin aglycone glucosyltransferase
VINNAVADALRESKLPKVRNFFSKPAERVLVGVSEKLFRPADAQIDPRFRYTGYCRWQAPEDATVDHEISLFTQGQRVPVLTFGSMVYERPGEVMERFVNAWPKDRKIIVQRGWAHFPALGDESNIKVIGKISHDQLFRHASAVVHHGGAGTTASVLHSGVPQIVVPHIGDQTYFGQQVERFGCGFRIAKAHWPEQLASSLVRLEANPTFATRASAVRTQLASENGPGRAVAELERFVAESTPAPTKRVAV